MRKLPNIGPLTKVFYVTPINEAHMNFVNNLNPLKQTKKKKFCDYYLRPTFYMPHIYFVCKKIERKDPKRPHTSNPTRGAQLSMFTAFISLVTLLNKNV